jgi:probable HAF family extracellular repeat protein
MRSFKSVFLRVVFATSVAAPAFCATPAYTAVDLGSLGGPCCAQAAGINDAGQVVGIWSAPGGASRAFLYSGGAMTDLGTLGGTASVAVGINASGQIAGSAKLAGDVAFHAFRYSGGTMTDLGTLGGTLSFARAINAAGQVAGVGYLTGNTATNAFLYSSGSLTDLGVLTLEADGINNAGQVVGEAFTPMPGGPSHAFLYNGGPIIDLGTLGGISSQATAINNAGQIVGISFLTGNEESHAFLYSGGSLIDLGALAPGGTSYALAINDAGQVVGKETDNTVERAFIYSNGAMVDLNNLVSLNTVLTDADGINISGQIIANGANNHAYLLTPIPPPLTITSPTSLPSGAMGVPYGPVPFSATGGAGGNHWTATGLPAGLAIDATTGVLGGMPTQSGLFNPQFTVTDSGAGMTSVALSLTINPPPPPPPVITSVSPNPVLIVNANQTLFVDGTGFTNGPQLRVRLTWQGGQVDFPVNFLNSTQVSLTFNFGVTPGNWTAQVINPDGQSSNIVFFLVVQPGSGMTTHFVAPQFTFGGAWYSALFLSNTTNTAATVQVTFTDDNAAPLLVTLVGIGPVTSQTVNLNAGATVVLEALNGDGMNSEGSVDVSLPPGVIGYVVFRQVVAGRLDQEALVPFTPESSQTADFTYEDILHATAVAFLNPSNQSVTITITAYGPDGAQVGTTQVPLAPGAKSTNTLKAYPGMAGIGGKQGRVVVSVTNGAVSILALRFGGSAFTNIPINYR